MNSKLRVGLQENVAGDSLDVYIVMRSDDSESSRIMRVGEHGYSHWENINGMVVQDPSFSFPNEIGRAMLDAMLRHYAGSQDMHTVRADLLHERGRVDRLITMYGDLADKVAENL